MQKLYERNKAKKLRLMGKSISEISKKLHIRWATISKWCKQLNLTSGQQKFISKQVLTNSQNKLKTYYFNKKKAKEIKIQKIRNNVNKDIISITNKELFLMGIMLYWAEGFKSKSEHRLGFCNSDPAMITFYLRWLNKCLKVNKNEITLRLTLNYSYKNKVDEVEKYWSELLKIPLKQFTKPFFQKTIWKKHYSNSKNYHGVLRIHVKKSPHLLWNTLESINRIKTIQLNDCYN